ncbi:MAG: TetR family transcriptional regulator [Mesorhizobium sp.]|nr:MAG: TetR family transcriptional regulator [Mesorhizobium sp.]
MAEFNGDKSGRPESWREQKKRETLKRITEEGVKLFVANGYEATTLDAIATAAGISRRTFFYYFKSKDDILLSLQTSGTEAVVAALMEEPADRPPLIAVRNALLKVCAVYQPDEMIVIDRLMLSSPTLQARKQASYLVQEQTLFAALSERWPDPRLGKGLRLVAMVAVGTMRLSLESWRAEGGKRPVAELVKDYFAAMQDAIDVSSSTN